MSTQETNLTAIADAIRAKEGTTAAIPAADFADRIAAIETDPTLQEKTVTSSTSAQTVTPDAGYDGLSKVTVNAISTATQATPSISVSSAGLITASATQTAGYVSAGTKSATKQLTTQAAKTVTPSTSSQTAVASGRYTTGAVTVSGDSNLVAGNIASGVSIFGVAGTYAGEGLKYYTARLSFTSGVAKTISPGFAPKYVFGIAETGIDTDVQDGYHVLAFFADSSRATSLDLHEGLADYDTLGYAYTYYDADASATLVWGTSSVKITLKYLKGYVNVHVFG